MEIKLGQSVEILRPLNQPRVLAEAICFLGIVFTMTGRYADALQLSYETLELAKSCKDQWFEALSLTEIANIEIILGEMETAAGRIHAVLDIWRVVGDPRFTAFALNFLSLPAARLGRFAEVRAALEENIALNEMVSDH